MDQARLQLTLKTQLGRLKVWLSSSQHLDARSRSPLWLWPPQHRYMLQHTPLAGPRLSCACGCTIPRIQICPCLHEAMTPSHQRQSLQSLPRIIKEMTQLLADWQLQQYMQRDYRRGGITTCRLSVLCTNLQGSRCAGPGTCAECHPHPLPPARGWHIYPRSLTGNPGPC